MDNFSITQLGKPLDESLYTIDKDNKVFVSKENDLVLDFAILNGWTFITGWDCTFITGAHCTFKTGGKCTFNTGIYCIFATDWKCTFKTDDLCTFHTGTQCTFITGYRCTFSIWYIDTCQFKRWDGVSTILDCADSKRYVLTKEFIQLQKIKNG